MSQFVYSTFGNHLRGCIWEHSSFALLQWCLELFLVNSGSLCLDPDMLWKLAPRLCVIADIVLVNLTTTKNMHKIVQGTRERGV